jgi:hypothetical protein
MHRLVVLIFVSAVLATAPAAADHGTLPVLRTGPTFGVGLGVGNMFSNCDDDFDCGTVLESGSLHAFAGGFLVSDTALVVEGWMTTHRDDRLTITNGLAVVAAQRWLVPRLWLKAGLGVARSSFSYDAVLVDIENRSEIAPGALAAAGVDVVQGGRSAFDIQLRYGAGLYDDRRARVHKLALSAGLSWH